MPVLATHTSATRSARRPAGHKPEDLRGGTVEPLSIVDDADERFLFSDLGEQRQDRQPYQEAVGRRSGAETEDRRHRVALWDWKEVDVVEHRRAKAGGGRCTPTPPRTRRQLLWQPASRRPGRSGSATTSSCRHLPLPEGQGLCSDRRAHPTRGGQALHTRDDVRSASHPERHRRSSRLLAPRP